MSSSTTLLSTLRNFNVKDAAQDFLSLECHTLRSAYNAAIVSGVLAISTHLVVSQLCKLLGNKLVAKVRVCFETVLLSFEIVIYEMKNV